MAHTNVAWEKAERSIDRGRRCQTTLTARRRRRQPWPRRHRRCLPYPLFPHRFTALTLWAATSVLAAPPPWREDRGPRAVPAPSRSPLVGRRALLRASTRLWQQGTSFLPSLHSLPFHLLHLTPPPPLCPPVPRVRPYVPRHYRKATSHTQILYLVRVGKRWMTWKARGGPEL